MPFKTMVVKGICWRGIWTAIISLPGMDWVCPLLAKELMMEWKAFSVGKRARKVWKTIPPSIF